MVEAEMHVSRNGPEGRSSERIISCTAFRLKFQVRWYVFVFLFLFSSHFYYAVQNILQKNECAASENKLNTVRHSGAVPPQIFLFPENLF